MPGAYRLSRAAASIADDRKMPVAAPLDPRAEKKLMAHIARARAPPRRALWRSPRSARPSRRPGCCSAPSATRAAGRSAERPVARLRRGRHPARPLQHAFHRPRRDAATAQAPLRHPLLHRRRQRHRAQDRRQGRRRFRAGRAGLAAAVRDQAAHRTDGDHRDRAAGAAAARSRRASATTCRCPISMSCTASGSGTCCNSPKSRQNWVSLTFAPRTLVSAPTAINL